MNDPSDLERDPWESGDLGRSLEHAVVVTDDAEEAAIDEALNIVSSEQRFDLKTGEPHERTG